MNIDKDGLASLLERVREAKGPDRELDYAISRFADGELARHSSLHLPYSASIDASMALVRRLLPDVQVQMCTDVAPGLSEAKLVGGDELLAHETGASLSLAILAALLLALKEVR